jgi:hypothetical protein
MGALLLLYVILFRAPWDIPLILVATSFMLSPFASFILEDSKGGQDIVRTQM